MNEGIESSSDSSQATQHLVSPPPLPNVGKMVPADPSERRDNRAARAWARCALVLVQSSKGHSRPPLAGRVRRRLREAPALRLRSTRSAGPRPGFELVCPRGVTCVRNPWGDRTPRGDRTPWGGGNPVGCPRPMGWPPPLPHPLGCPQPMGWLWPMGCPHAMACPPRNGVAATRWGGRGLCAAATHGVPATHAVAAAHWVPATHGMAGAHGLPARHGVPGAQWGSRNTRGPRVAATHDVPASGGVSATPWVAKLMGWPQPMCGRNPWCDPDSIRGLSGVDPR